MEQWIKSSERLPKIDKTVRIRRTATSGQIIEDIAALSFYDGYYWDGVFGLYEASESIEWLDECHDPDKEAAIKHIEYEIQQLTGRSGMTALIRSKLQKILDILNGQKP